VIAEKHNEPWYPESAIDSVNKAAACIGRCADIIPQNMLVDNSVEMENFLTFMGIHKAAFCRGFDWDTLRAQLWTTFNAELDLPFPARHAFFFYHVENEAMMGVTLLRRNYTLFEIHIFKEGRISLARMKDIANQAVKYVKINDPTCKRVIGMFPVARKEIIRYARYSGWIYAGCIKMADENNQDILIYQDPFVNRAAVKEG